MPAPLAMEVSIRVFDDGEVRIVTASGFPRTIDKLVFNVTSRSATKLLKRSLYRVLDCFIGIRTLKRFERGKKNRTPPTVDTSTLDSEAGIVDVGWSDETIEVPWTARSTRVVET